MTSDEQSAIAKHVPAGMDPDEWARVTLDAMVSEMKRMTTEARRVHEVSAALAARTGRPEDQSAAGQAARVVLELDAALEALLRREDQP